MPVSRAPVPLRASDAAIDRERFPGPPEVLAQVATSTTCKAARQVTSAAAGGDRQASQLRRALASADTCRPDAQTRRVRGTWRV